MFANFQSKRGRGIVAVARSAAGFLLDLHTNTGWGKKKNAGPNKDAFLHHVCAFAICCCIQSIVVDVKESLLVPSAD